MVGGEFKSGSCDDGLLTGDFSVRMRTPISFGQRQYHPPACDRNGTKRKQIKGDRLSLPLLACLEERKVEGGALHVVGHLGAKNGGQEELTEGEADVEHRHPRHKLHKRGMKEKKGGGGENKK